MKTTQKRILTAVMALLLTVSTHAFASGTMAAAPLWVAGEKRDKIIVVSDIHLGIDDSFAESAENKRYLIDFLQKLQATGDVRELVIAGDFLDEWYLPLDYPAYLDSSEFYRRVIANNQSVMDELKNVMAAGIKLVYVPGNHDLLLESSVLDEALPGIVQARDVLGLGVYYAGDRGEIAIEHSHRYDVFSAPDTLTNAQLCGNGETVLPAGYFYARYAASWVVQGRPTVEKNLPVVTKMPDPSDADQMGAYAYYKALSAVAARMTPIEAPEDKIFDIHIAGFDDSYSFLDFYPAQQADGTISAPVLYQNIQRTWDGRQSLNGVSEKSDFISAVLGQNDWAYYLEQAKRQYFERADRAVDVVVFGHTHIPIFETLDDGKLFINDGTWVDHNTDYPDATRTFAVITTGEKDAADLFMYGTDGTIKSIKESVKK